MLTRHRTTRHFLATVAIATVASLLFALPAAATPAPAPPPETGCVEESEEEGDVQCVVEEEEVPAATGTLYIRKTIRDDLQLANIADALENDLKKVASHPNALTNTDYAGPTLFQITVTQDGTEVSANGWSRSGGRSNTYKASYMVIAGVAVTLSEADLAGWEEGTFECRPGDVGTNANGFWIEGGKWASAVESDTVIVPEGGKVTCRIMNTQVDEPEVIEEPKIEEPTEEPEVEQPAEDPEPEVEQPEPPVIVETPVVIEPVEVPVVVEVEVEETPVVDEPAPVVEADDSNESEVQGLVLEAVQTLPETGLETHETAALAGGLILLGAALLFTSRESEPGFRS